MQAKILISGPGGTINTELHVIRKALEAVGFICVVKNDYPTRTQASDAEIDEFIKKMEKPYPVHIEMDHEPWPG